MANLVPFAETYVMKPLIDLFKPTYNDFKAPFEAIHQDFYIPATSLFRGRDYQTHEVMSHDEAKQKYEKVLASVVRVGVTFAIFLAYQKAWTTGSYYMGVVGGLTGFVVCLSIFNAIDARSNDLGRAVWFLYRGTISLLRSFGESRGALLCLVLVRAKDYKEETGLLTNPTVQNLIKSTAGTLANWSHPAPARTSPQGSPKPSRTTVDPVSPPTLSEEEAK